MKPIPGYEGYFATKKGEILSFRVPGPGSKVDMKRKPLSLSFGMQSNGKYYVCHIRQSNGKLVTRNPHRLIALAFHGRPPTSKHQCSHINGSAFDNRPENLVWESIKKNHARKIAHGTDDCGYRNSRAKLNKEEIEEMKLMIAIGGKTQAKIGEIFGVSRVFVAKVANGYRYKR